MVFLEESKSVLIQPQGLLDSQGGASLQQQISAIEHQRYPLWILDLSQVEFIDSAGLFALVSGLNTASRNQCRLVVCNLPPAVQIIFEITQLDQAFEIFESQADVAAAYQRTPMLLHSVRQAA
ncbi:STAS domain-containing protein [Leptolyngbya sp. FACHB-36]|uniref:STAS domain-containing protein n=1 Tax=Leptolyngbya sp. FACHB-36 TaxID=2692808 RepID=UPI0016807355|nr:STAS domain-containing protein [Leptolyngbya sp. FACHB-36]MBD2021809.1 STAS domain-containing protein [Leptolyngbya sp. FACHB-36]